MATFKIKGTAIEELPELEIEAETLEEAQKRYEDMYENNEIDSEGYYMEYEGEELDEDDEEY